MLKVGIIGIGAGAADLYRLLNSSAYRDSMSVVLLGDVPDEDELVEQDVLVADESDEITKKVVEFVPLDKLLCDDDLEWPTFDEPCCEDMDSHYWEHATGKGSRVRRRQEWRSRTQSGPIKCSRRFGNSKKRGRNKRC